MTNTFKIFTHDRNGNQKIMFVSFDTPTIKDAIKYVQCEMWDKCCGETTISKVFANSRNSKQHKVF